MLTVTGAKWGVVPGGRALNSNCALTSGLNSSHPLLQMHHPIQMKPADSEKNNGKDLQLFDPVHTSLRWSSPTRTTAASPQDSKEPNGPTSTWSRSFRTFFFFLNTYFNPHIFTWVVNLIRVPLCDRCSKGTRSSQCACYTCDCAICLDTE